MNIADLDEAEGLTAEIARAAAEARGFTYRGTDLHSPNGGVALFFATNTHCLGAVVKKLAEHAGLSIQAILREMNPRLRPWPSAAERAAHDGLWLAVCPEDETACMGRFRSDIAWFSHSGNLILTEDDAFARFWPCDAHGNKCRWPKVPNV